MPRRRGWAAAGCVAFALFTGSAHAAVTAGPIDFESGYSLGDINGQNGWKKTSSSFDVNVADPSTFPAAAGYGFGTRALQLSNKFVNGSFSDQTYSPVLSSGAGEGLGQHSYSATFTIGTALATEQPGLQLSVGPSSADGGRLSLLGFADQSDGVHVAFTDATDTGPAGKGATFTTTDIATLDRAHAHVITFSIAFADGPANDVVKVYIDGALTATGTTWEDYWRYDPQVAASGGVPPAVTSLLFRLSGAPAPATAGKGFLVDAVTQQALKGRLAFSTTPPSAVTIGDTYLAHADDGEPLDPVKYVIDTPSVCSAGPAGDVHFDHAGTCTVAAIHPGLFDGLDYGAEPRVTQSIVVPKLAQNVSFTTTPPANATAGGQAAVAASGGPSGNPVVLTLAAGSSGCTLSGGVVTFTAIGTCLIEADQAGTDDYAAGHAQQVIQISAKPPDPTPTPTPAPAPPAPLPLTCTGKSIALIGVDLVSGKVAVSGLALPAYAGQTVTVTPSSKQAKGGSAVVQADGTFAAKLAAPATKLRKTIRYTATVAGKRSAVLKLTRALTITRQSATAAAVKLTAHVDHGKKGQKVTVTQQLSCASTKPFATVKLDAKGNLSVSLPAPAKGDPPTYYRVTAKLGGGSTYSLPIAVRAG